MTLKPIVAVAAIVAAMVSPAHSQNLLTNGGFEADTQAAGTWGTYGSLAGWTGEPSIELRNAVAGTALGGVNFVELDTAFNSGMSQTFSVNSVGSYLLSFAFSARPETAYLTNGLAYSLTSGVTELLGGTIRPAANSSASHQWETFSQSLGLAAGSYTLSFYAIGRSDSFGTSLDNVSVSAVPEPGSLALMVAGLGVVGFMAKRRRQRG